MATFAMTCELEAASLDQQVGSVAVKRLATRVAVK
jgi:hypothetical protein